MDYVYTAYTVYVTIFSTGGKFRPVSNFTELHALTPAAHSYALLLCGTGCWQSHLPPVSNPSSEGGEVGQHPVISHHVREEGAVGATSAEAVTH